MDYYRAEEIINSEATIEVFYNKHSVWIHNLDPRKEMAQVSNTLEEMFDVPVTDLKEGNVLSE